MILSKKLRDQVVVQLFVMIFAASAVLATELPYKERCDDAQSKRISVGPQKLLSLLRKNAEESNSTPFFVQGQFHHEEFKYIGSIKHVTKIRYELVLLTTIWGEGCRATRRLLIFDPEGKYVGSYASLQDAPIRILNSKLLFPYKSVDGNNIDFSSANPPSQVRLDGEIFKFQAVRNQ